MRMHAYSYTETRAHVYVWAYTKETYPEAMSIQAVAPKHAKILQSPKKMDRMPYN